MRDEVLYFNATRQALIDGGMTENAADQFLVARMRTFSEEFDKWAAKERYEAIKRLKIRASFDPIVFVNGPRIKQLKDIPAEYRVCIDGIRTNRDGIIVSYDLPDRAKEEEALIELLMQGAPGAPPEDECSPPPPQPLPPDQLTVLSEEVKILEKKVTR